MKLLKNIRRRLNSDEDSVCMLTISAPVSGRILTLAEVDDPTFSEHILGDGFAIVPEDGVIKAPADAVIESVAQTSHAVSMRTDGGVELLIHVGIDTVELDGKYFRVPVSVGDHVKTGDVLIEADLDSVKQAGYDTVTPVIVTNMDEVASVSAAADTAEAGKPFLILGMKTK